MRSLTDLSMCEVLNSECTLSGEEKRTREEKKRKKRQECRRGQEKEGKDTLISGCKSKSSNAKKTKKTN